MALPSNPIILALLSAGTSFAVLFAIFRPLELAFPARPGQRVLRPHFLTDLAYMLGQYFLFNAAVFWILTHFEPYLRLATPDSLRSLVASTPFWIQFPLVILLGDFLIYWAHRLQHRVGFLWRFHAIHHSAEHLDWLAAHREHPLDGLYTIAIVNFPVFVLGFPVESLAAFAAFRGLWAIFIHSNVRIPLPFLRVLIGSPELHHWHHDRNRDAGNYGNLSPIMDKLFGTYTCPDHEPHALGLPDPFPQTYLAQLLHPFLPTRNPPPDPSALAPPAPPPDPQLMQPHHRPTQRD